MGEKGQNVKGEILLKSPNEVEWKIPDFFSLPHSNSYFFDSPSFSYLDGTWCLECWPDSPVQGILLRLKRIHSTSHRHNITFKLGIKEKEGLEYISRMRNSNFDIDGEKRGVFLHVNRAYLQRNEPYFSQRLEISFFCMLPFGSSKDALSQTIRSKAADKVIEDLEELFLSGNHHDIVIKVQDQEIRAHKLIIVARCPVFAAMFRHDTIEKNTGVVTVEDCDPEIFREFLFFLYSGKLKSVSAENVVEIYVIADKYQVEEIKSLCLECMMKNMSDETFCDFISLALKHSERDLLNFATDYFVKNVKTIIETVKWQRFHKEYPVESHELYIKVITRRIPD